MTLPWRLKAWDGSQWAEVELRRWNGAQWTVTNGYYWDGSSWVLLTDRTPPTQTIVGTYPVVWHQTYQQNNTQRTDTNGFILNYQGNSGSSSYGNQRSMWGISSNIQSDISGAVAFYMARTYFQNIYTWYNSGGTARIGTHRSTAKPTTWQQERDGFALQFFAKGQELWIYWDPNVILSDAVNDAFYGFTLFTGSNDVQYYGYWSDFIQFECSYEK